MNTSKARKRLERANAAVTELISCDKFKAFEHAWLDFLLHSKGVYTQLEQSCKVTPQSRQWFGAKKRERKSDEMLQYLFQARDSEEHTLENVTEIDPGHTIYGVEKEGYSNHITFYTGVDGSTIVKPLDGKPLLCETKPNTVKLLPVTGRGGVIYNPPTHHKGKPIGDTSPITLAKLCVQHLSDLISEAEGLA